MTSSSFPETDDCKDGDLTVWLRRLDCAATSLGTLTLFTSYDTFLARVNEADGFWDHCRSFITAVSKTVPATDVLLFISPERT